MQIQMVRGKDGRFVGVSRLEYDRLAKVAKDNEALHDTSRYQAEQARGLERDLWGWVPISLRPGYVAPVGRDPVSRRMRRILSPIGFFGLAN